MSRHMRFDIEKWSAGKRALIYIAVVALIILGYAAFYNYGMSVFEGRDKTFSGSVQFVVQSMTTTGYGGDAPWNTAIMNLFVVGVQLTGLVLVFMLFPLFALPALHKTIRPSIPRRTSANEHIVICGYTEFTQQLRRELALSDVSHVVVIEEEEKAREVQREGWHVVYADPLTQDGLEAANIREATAVLTDRTDEENAHVLMMASRLSDAKLITTVTNRENLRFLSYAGADVVVSPKQLIGRALAAYATSAVSDELEPGTHVTQNLEVVEFPVGTDSTLVGKTIGELRLSREEDAQILGLWRDGAFIRQPSASTYLTENSVLVAAGNEEQLKRLRDLCRTRWRRSWQSDDGHIVVIGNGEVGSRVAEDLREHGEDVITIDKDSRSDADVFGDARDERVLQKADIETAKVVVVALGSDESSMFATLVVNRISDAKIIVRGNQQDKVKNIYRAGADYVLSLSAVSGRMLASYLLDQDIRSLHQQIRIVQTKAPELTGQTLADGGVHDLDVMVLAVQRGDAVFTNPVADFTAEEDDAFILAGTDTDIATFRERFG